MSLDEELRAALGREAEHRTAPPPDVDGLIRGGRVRRRRRNTTRLGVGVVATVLVGATAFGVVTLGPRGEGDVVASTPGRTDPPSLRSLGRETLDPGTFRMFVGLGAAGGVVSADATVDGPHWKHNDFPYVSDPTGRTHAGFGVYQPQAVAAGNGCQNGPTEAALAETPEGLVAQLAGLPRSTVLQEPSRTEVLAVPAVHLRLRIDVDCPGYYRVANAAGGTRGITYSPAGAPEPNVVIDFWVLEVDGAVIVVDEWRDVEAPAEVVAQAHEARTSIILVEGR